MGNRNFENINMYSDLKEIFNLANNDLLNLDKHLFEINVSERTLCGALMLRLYERLKESKYSNYYVDVEYNRHNGKNPKRIIKVSEESVAKEANIYCDLIVHSRGKYLEQDNLIAIEMKKSCQEETEKEEDKRRLEFLTKCSSKLLPKYDYRYVIGIYYEINYETMQITLEYYTKGRLKSKDIRDF